MSLLLKGIDLPKCSNEDIMVVIRRDKAEVWQTGYKERTVEAIQIPTPHGRLIDADKVFCYNFWDEQNIDNAPTIIEAEEADENQV